MSTIKANSLQDASGRGYYAPRAWVNWKNSGGNSLLADQGISSVSDTATGCWQNNFDNAFANVNYASAGSNGENGSTTNNAAISFNTGSGGNANTTTYRRCSAENVDSGYSDYNFNAVIFVGDL